MRLTHVLTFSLGLATIAIGASASANDLGEDSTWQFRNANTTVQMQNNLSYIAARRMGTLGASGAQGLATLGSGAGLLTSATTATNNFTQVVNETSISCEGAGTVCTATGGGNTTTVGQTSTGSTSSAHAEATGNTLTNNSNNSNTSNTGYGTTTFNGVAER
jgi:hypothetical protein